MTNRSMSPHVQAKPTGTAAAEAPPPAPIDQTLEAFERFMQLVSVGHATEMIEVSMSMAQMKVLYLLGTRRELHMSELVVMLGVSISTVSGLVDRLVDAGYASRRDDPDDRRHVMVGLTAAGSDVLDRFRELGKSRMKALLERCSANDLATVRRAIDVLTAAASRKEAK
jgi:DNA-binding MarR family transcriptional regulator